jgi:hypothetical protein
MTENDFVLPAPPSADEFISYEAAVAYFEKNVAFTHAGKPCKVSHDYLVDTTTNMITYIQSGLGHILGNNRQICPPEYMLALRPDLRNYEGIEDAILKSSNYSVILRRLINFSKLDPELPLGNRYPVTKVTMHLVFNQLHSLFDPDPNNQEASYNRKLIEGGARALELPELGTDKYAGVAKGEPRAALRSPD